MLEVTILTRVDCHLCHVVERMAQRVQTEIAFQFATVTIEQDPQLAARYGEHVPVVLIDHEEVLSGKFLERDLRRAIKRARWRRPVSRILSHVKRGSTRG